MSKLKKIICGFLAGALVFTGVTGFSAVNAEAAEKTVKMTEKKADKLMDEFDKRTVKLNLSMTIDGNEYKVPFELDSKKGIEYFDMSGCVNTGSSLSVISSGLVPPETSTYSAISAVKSIGKTYIDMNNLMLYSDIDTYYGSKLKVKVNMYDVIEAQSKAFGITDTDENSDDAVIDSDAQEAGAAQLDKTFDELAQVKGTKKGNIETYVYDNITLEKLGLTPESTGLDAESLKELDHTYKLVAQYNTKNGRFKPYCFTIYVDGQQLYKYSDFKFSNKESKNIRNFKKWKKGSKNVTKMILKYIEESQ